MEPIAAERAVDDNTADHEVRDAKPEDGPVARPLSATLPGRRRRTSPSMLPLFAPRNGSIAVAGMGARPRSRSRGGVCAARAAKPRRDVEAPIRA
jgi:hypothetical protein